MRKRIIAMAALVIMAMSMSGCNKQIFDFNYTFDKAIIQRGDKEIIVDIEGWKDYEGEQIQLKLTDGSVILVSSYNTILVSSVNGNSIIFQ